MAIKRNFKRLLGDNLYGTISNMCYALKLKNSVLNEMTDAVVESIEWMNVSKNAIKNDMRICAFKYGISPYEYKIFNFHKLSGRERKKYLAEREFMRICDDSTSKHNQKLFREKYETYETFAQFYKRKCIKITPDTPIEDISSFISEHKRFVLKALAKSKGTDNFVFDDNLAIDKTVESVISIVNKVGTCIAEEFIEQSPEMAKYHPQSVNTLRFATYKVGDEVTKLFALVRIGAGNAHIDNVSAGGMFAVVDLDTGIVTTPGIKRVGDKILRFNFHPDTGVQILGSIVPRWDEAADLVTELAYVVKDQHFVGWDLALSKNGWVMVEGNHRASLDSIQMGSKTGMKPVIYDLLRKAKTNV